MKVTLIMLKRAKACKSQRDRFAELFPKGVDVTEAACVAVAQEFDWGWAARCLLPAPLDADYEAKLAPLYADYAAKRAPLYADYAAKRAPLYADYAAKLAALFGRLAETIK
ncbi:MAG: hypothetical protein KGL39_05060 [Patescibacteria group bacterium]|nr:hypothetical protein [Patescibacteria group bacterium]